ncbi:MAG: peptidoglycan-binding protein [Candidatus Omnitrophica bacterium]|nr:peptidoglycan-binding protein [Candidatus Omnitrophota bacterium]
MRKVVLLLTAGVFAFGMAGCATAPKQNSEVNGLKNQISTLEDQLRARDEEITTLKDELNRAPQAQGVAAAETCVKQSAKSIQTALNNAGYYNGPIDGRIGKQTRDGIKEFQKANNLKVDGRVGSKTWAVLKAYLEKKVK